MLLLTSQKRTFQVLASLDFRDARRRICKLCIYEGTRFTLNTQACHLQ